VFVRVGLDHRAHDILWVPIREVLLPVRPGRNMSAIIEIAARHELLRQSGRDSSKEFVDKVDLALTGRTNESGTFTALPPVRARTHTPVERRAREYESGVPPPPKREKDD
jgi:HPr kinase/phosphorylase